MPESVQLTDLRTRQIPIIVMPDAQEALHEALSCLDTAGKELRRGRGDRTDEVLELLRAAASHLESAWDLASQRDEVPPHMRGAE